MLHSDGADMLTMMREAASRMLDAGTTMVRDFGDRNYLTRVLAEEVKHRTVAAPHSRPVQPSAHLAATGISWAERPMASKNFGCSA